MLANLWDVTDRDIDGMTERLLKAWHATGSQALGLAEALVDARRLCTLPYLTGSAMVIYGFFAD